MKKTFVTRCTWALGLFLGACASKPAFVENPPREDQASDWAQGDNYAAYKNKAARSPSAKKITTYKTQGTCGGYPRIDVQTAPGFCVGLVFDGSQTFTKVRWSAPWGNNRVLLTEMGGWAEFNGKIYALDFSKKPAQLKLILSRANFANAADPARGILDRPNQILLHEGRYYVGGAKGLYRFDPASAQPERTVEVLIKDLPAVGLHPLKSFAFDTRGGLFINVGSASNVCQNFTSVGDTNPERNPRNYQRRQFPNCPEVENTQIGQGQVRRYQVLADGRISSDYQVYAKGLRNSIGLLWDEKHAALLDTENGRDAISKFAPELANADHPPEELNLLRQPGQHFGWPYCYGNNRNNPEWKNIDCSGYTPPYVALPAHSAPLGMLIHSGNAWPEWYKDRLLIALHGYEAKGHRIVAMKRNDEGLPTGIPQSVVFGWDERGAQGVGKPVSLLELADGSVLIVEDEDQNKILRLVYDPSLGNGVPVQEIDQKKTAAPPAAGELTEDQLRERFEAKIKAGDRSPFVQFQQTVINKYCIECHAAAGSPGVQLIKFDDIGNQKRIRESGKAATILSVLRGDDNYPAMPPQGWESAEEQRQAVDHFQSWMKTP